jgi:hypothetical protein
LQAPIKRGVRAREGRNFTRGAQQLLEKEFTRGAQQLDDAQNSSPQKGLLMSPKGQALPSGEVADKLERKEPTRIWVCQMIENSQTNSFFPYQQHGELNSTAS